jgi:surface polysaccharide O-acyltransferase-like enzyme
MTAMLAAYMRGVDKAVDATPTQRNRVVDTWRVIALLVVVFGHWLAASVWVDPGGDTVVMNTLEWIPHAAWFTWIVQVMPVFFFVGGYANAKAISARTTDRRTWLTVRFRRLFAPAVPVIVVWTVLALVLRQWIDADLVYAGVLNATLPLWFLAVYLTLVAMAPATFAMWRRWGLPSVLPLIGGAIVVDVAYRALDVPGIGWLNLVFVWAAVHQFGYWWADREVSGDVLTPSRAWALSACALAALIAVTWVGWYPVAMITIPGGGPQNVTPPTSAVILLSLVQIGIILATKRGIAGWASRRRNWRFVVAISGFIMSIYVWHLTALSLVIATGIFTFDGVAFSPEPGTALWWGVRPLFYAVLIAVTGLLVVTFGRFEQDIDTTPPRRPLPVMVFGMAACIAALAGTAFVYLVNREADVTWWIPVVAVVASAVVGAYPSAWRARRFERVR